MRILLVGQAAFAEQVLAGLQTAGHRVVGVLCPPDRGDKPDPVKAAALAGGIAVSQFPSLKTPAAREAFAAADADLAVLAYVTQIVPEALLQLPRHTPICFHPSLLPRYRGGSATPWQLIRGETRSGVTVFWPDAGIDTGPVLLQREAAVDPDDTAGSLYFKKLFPLGVQTVLDSVQLIAQGRAPREPQDDRCATYEPRLTDVHAAIDWRRPGPEVHNLIRGCDPQPGAHTTWRGTRLRLFEPRRDERGGTPGQVLAVDAQGLVMATGTGSIRCTRAPGGGPDAAPAARARPPGTTPGAR